VFGASPWLWHWWSCFQEAPEPFWVLQILLATDLRFGAWEFDAPAGVTSAGLPDLSRPFTPFLTVRLFSMLADLPRPFPPLLMASTFSLFSLAANIVVEMLRWPRSWPLCANSVAKSGLRIG
jgi:hypothetical protein